MEGTERLHPLLRQHLLPLTHPRQELTGQLLPPRLKLLRPGPSPPLSPLRMGRKSRLLKECTSRAKGDGRPEDEVVVLLGHRRLRRGEVRLEGVVVGRYWSDHQTEGDLFILRGQHAYSYWIPCFILWPVFSGSSAIISESSMECCIYFLGRREVLRHRGVSAAKSEIRSICFFRFIYYLRVQHETISVRFIEIS